jgi:hypothetical protein
VSPRNTGMVARFIHQCPAPAPRIATKLPQTAAPHSHLVTSNASASSVHVSIASPDVYPAPAHEPVYPGIPVSLFLVDNIASLLVHSVPSLDHSSVPTGPVPSEICTR